jgi:hypothetical protein
MIHNEVYFNYHIVNINRKRISWLLYITIYCLKAFTLTTASRVLDSQARSMHELKERQERLDLENKRLEALIKQETSNKQRLL